MSVVGWFGKNILKYYQKVTKCVVDIVVKTRNKEINKYSVDLLRKKDIVTLLSNTSLAISRMISLKKKIDRQILKQDIAIINWYIKDWHATKIQKSTSIKWMITSRSTSVIAHATWWPIPKNLERFRCSLRQEQSVKIHHSMKTYLKVLTC